MEYFLRSEAAKIISALVLCCTKIVPACYFARPLTRGAGQIAFQLSPSLLPGDLQLSVIIRYRCFALLGAFFFWGTVPPRWSYFMVAQKLLSGFFPLRGYHFHFLIFPLPLQLLLLHLFFKWNPRKARQLWNYRKSAVEGLLITYRNVHFLRYFVFVFLFVCDLISMLSQVAANVPSYCLNFESSFETERARFLLCWLSDSGKREKTLGLSQGKLIELGTRWEPHMAQWLLYTSKHRTMTIVDGDVDHLYIHFIWSQDNENDSRFAWKGEWKIDFDYDTLDALVVAKGYVLKGWKRTMGKFRWFLSDPYERDSASSIFEFLCENIPDQGCNKDQKQHQHLF